MPCSPNDNQINVQIPPPPTIPGFGAIFSPIQIGLPGFDLPTDLLEDFEELIKKLGAIFPSGIFKPFPDLKIKDIFGFISSILTQIAPFLSLYNFFLALLRIIACVIEVLCAIPNPFAVASKLATLFTECLPPFLNLFPPFALIAMIIALLLLILALIEYIINTILDIINSIIKNLEIFANAASLQDAQATLAAVQKIASLLCFLENILSIFLALAAIFDIIKSIANFAGVTICDDSDQEGCCPIALCPPFIKNTPDGITTTQGKLIYLKQIGVDIEDTLSLSPALAALFNIPPIRQERWQIFDKNLTSEYKINQIITPIIPGISDDFWAETAVLNKDTSPRRAPYTVDIKLEVNPAQFGFIDFRGPRQFLIKDCIVIEKPYIGVYSYNNSVDFTQGILGTLSISGGKVYDLLDGYESEYLINGEQATLDTFIHLSDSKSQSTPTSDDSIVFDNIEFTWKPNAPALAGYNVTTVGCIPEVAVERAAINAVISAEGIQPVNFKLPNVPDGQKVPSTGVLPNIEGAYQCLLNSITSFRNNISIEGAAEFQAASSICLTDLQNQTTAALCSAIIAAISQFKSDYEFDTNLQFTTNQIKVTVYLRDASNILLTSNIPQSCADEIAARLKGEVTFGEISKFTYDGSNYFIANISSNLPGDGEMTLLFDNKVISKFITATAESPSLIQENVKTYSFVDAGIAPPVRRNETDVE